VSQLAEATIEDLYREPGKAELINGRIVRSMPTGLLPNRVAFRIVRSLDDHSQTLGSGLALTDNIGFTIPALASGRQSFSPDASFYNGPLPRNVMRFIEGPPTLAVEVRSEGDYGPSAEDAIASKRADYFEAGTLVVWDVDPLDEVIRVFRCHEPEKATVYRRGEVANAKPAVAGWTIAVDELFGQVL